MQQTFQQAWLSLIVGESVACDLQKASAPTAAVSLNDSLLFEMASVRCDTVYEGECSFKDQGPLSLPVSSDCAGIVSLIESVAPRENRQHFELRRIDE